MATTRKKKTTRKKTSKTATRKTAAKKPAKKAAAAKKPAAKAKAPVKSAAAPEVSLESRLLAPIAELESLLERFRKSRFPNPLNWEWPPTMDFTGFFEGRPPSVDIIDRDTAIIARAEIPGVDKENLEINVGDRSLTIKGKTRHEEEKTEGDIHRREISAGAFVRTVTLPDAVDGRRTKATYKDGLLELKMPKLKRSKKHSITID
ncbi:MAG: Hsp20/alpha crystallin family protein [Chromatiales bacterium]|nr:MAG: Hsp20/alpha crystallin family protein [Chromatiales bacterium]